MATLHRRPRYRAALFFLVLITFAGTGTPLGKFPPPADGTVTGEFPKAVFSAAPPLLPHVTPDIAFTTPFRSAGLGYVHSVAFAEAMREVAAGTSRYSPRTIPASWPAIAREWTIHMTDFPCGKALRPSAGIPADPGGSAPRIAIRTLFPRRDFFREGTDRVGSFLFLSSLEYRARQGNGRTRLITPSLVRMGVGEILASVEKRREETRGLEDRLSEIASRIVSAEELGAPERCPRELALVRAELRYARHASTDGSFDLWDAEISIQRAERAAEHLLVRLNAPSS